MRKHTPLAAAVPRSPLVGDSWPLSLLRGVTRLLRGIWDATSGMTHEEVCDPAALW